MKGKPDSAFKVKMELEFIQVNLYGIFDHFATIQIHLKNSIVGMVRRGLKKCDGSNGEVYESILIFLKTHVNHQGDSSPRGGTMKGRNSKMPRR